MTNTSTLPALRSRSAQTHSSLHPAKFLALMQGVAVVAGLTHVAFCSLFFYNGVDVLGYINMGSILCYVLIFWLIQRGDGEKTWMLALLEVIGHAVIAVYLIGWDSGFQFYLILVIPMAVVASIPQRWVKATVAISTMCLYLGMDVYCRTHVAPYPLTEASMLTLHYFNVMGMMVILLFLAIYYQQLITKAECSLRDIASTDPLTQLHNRRSIDELIQIEHERVLRGQQDLTFILCDLDHFKKINDGHGHDIGDLVLQTIGKQLADCVRKVDYVARWGGEEFLVVLPHTDTQGALLVAERMRTGIAALSIPTPKGSLSVSMTLGIAMLSRDESIDDAVRRADAALYAGKHAGRNRVMVAEAAGTHVGQTSNAH